MGWSCVKGHSDCSCGVTQVIYLYMRAVTLMARKKKEEGKIEDVEREMMRMRTDAVQLCKLLMHPVQWYLMGKVGRLNDQEAHPHQRGNEKDAEENFSHSDLSYRS